MTDFDCLSYRHQMLLKIKLDAYIEAAVQAAHKRNIGLQESLSLMTVAVVRDLAAYSLSRERANEILAAAVGQVYEDAQKMRPQAIN
jgi:hypothetical protein